MYLAHEQTHDRQVDRRDTVSLVYQAGRHRWMKGEYTERQTDRHKYREADGDRQTHRQDGNRKTGRQGNRQANRQTDTDRQADRLTGKTGSYSNESLHAPS